MDSPELTHCTLRNYEDAEAMVLGYLWRVAYQRAAKTTAAIPAKMLPPWCRCSACGRGKPSRSMAGWVRAEWGDDWQLGVVCRECCG